MRDDDDINDSRDTVDRCADIYYNKIGANQTLAAAYQIAVTAMIHAQLHELSDILRDIHRSLESIRTLTAASTTTR